MKNQGSLIRNNMERCNNCGEYRKYINEEGICILCERGPGGKPVEKKVNPDQEYGLGKPIKSAFIEKEKTF